MDKHYNLNQDSEPNNRNGIKLILKHTKPYILNTIIIIVAVIATNIFGNVLIPKLAQKAIDIDIANKDMTSLLSTVYQSIILLVITGISNYIRVKTTGIFSQKVLFDIRQEVFKKIQTLPTQFISDNETGDIIQRLTGNVETLSSFFSEGLVRFLNLFVMMITIIITMFLLNWQVALIPLLSAILVITFILLQGKLVEKPIKESLDKEGSVSAKTQETLDGFISITSANQQRNWYKQFENLNNQYYKIAKKVIAISSTSDTFINFMSTLCISISILYALRLLSIESNGMTLGIVVLFVNYTQQLFRNLDKVSYIWRIIKTGLGSSARLYEILELESNITNPQAGYSPIEIKGEIQFKDVDFGYNGTDVVLKDVDFTAYPGKTIAIVGPTGGGKTTFVNLVARLYDVRNGQILVDGVDVKEWDLPTLREGIGYLIQDTFLFEDTILNNLRYDNPNITEKEALDIFEFLGVSPFIQSLPNGLNTKIESDGNGISSGQRQIIALARILLRDPKILILDEATARIDTKSEKLLQTAIEKAVEGKTTFVIAHRLSTIFNANHIILIKDNTILEQGNHEQLIEKKGFYYEMYSKFVGN